MKPEAFQRLLEHMKLRIPPYGGMSQKTVASLYGCEHCQQLPTDHLDDGKCLFETTYYDPPEWTKPFKPKGKK